MIEIIDLCKSFDTGSYTVDALSDINITIEDGDIYGIIGMSGAGKSTLVRCINMLEKPTSGRVIVNGKEMGLLSDAQLRAARREISMIFQQFNLLKQRNCLQNICFPLELNGVPKAQREKRDKKLIDSDIESFLNNRKVKRAQKRNSKTRKDIDYDKWN